jgi:hypothetical protein
MNVLRFIGRERMKGFHRIQIYSLTLLLEFGFRGIAEPNLPQHRRQRAAEVFISIDSHPGFEHWHNSPHWQVASVDLETRQDGRNLTPRARFHLPRRRLSRQGSCCSSQFELRQWRSHSTERRATLRTHQIVGSQWCAGSFITALIGLG